MKNIILIIGSLISLLLSCVKHNNINENNIPILIKNNNLNDTIEKLVFYNYPKKWNFNIGEYPLYNSIKDSLADDRFNKLSFLGDSLYKSSIIDKKSPLNKFDDTELKNIYKKLLPEKFYFPYGHKWDIPYFVDVLKENQDYKLSLYKNGDKFDKCGEYTTNCNFFVVKYLLLEFFNKKTKEKKYFISFITDNNNIESFKRYYCLNGKSIFIIDFYSEEIQTFFLKRKEYNLN